MDKIHNFRKSSKKLCLFVEGSNWKQKKKNNFKSLTIQFYCKYESLITGLDALICKL